MAKTLLLADGSATIQRVVDLTFAHEDIRVVAVPDGSRAIKWLDTERPDIVLVDVDLAEVDGYGIVTHVKQSKKLGGVPVLMLAGAFEPVDQDRVRAIGCDGIVVKPFEPQHLVARVKELLAVAGGLGRSAGSREPAGRAPLYTGSSDSPSLAILRGASRPAAAPPPDRLELPTRPAWETTPPQAAPAKVSLATAFSALLAAEQSTQTAQPAQTQVQGLTDASVEDAVRRVLVKMTDDLVRRLIVETAERLIREEIQKIKLEG
jgi:CheY-like chemotaxis protein